MKMYAKTTPEQREVVATVLRGEAMLALIRQCAQDNDVDFLRTLKRVGRFDVEPEDLFHEGSNVHALMNGRCLPWVDALGAQLLVQAHDPVTWSTGLSSRPEVQGRHLNVRRSQEMQSFMRELVAETLDSIVTIRQNMLPPLASDRVVIERIDSTLVVMNAIACATNDVDLLKVMQVHGLRKHIDTGDLVDPMGMASGDHQDTVRMSPVAFAIRTGSMQVLDHLSATCSDLMDGGVGKRLRQNTNEFRPLSVGELLDLSNMAPSPEVMRWLLRSHQTEASPESEQADGNGSPCQVYEGPFALWLKDIALPMLSLEWVHLTQVAMDERVFELDLPNSALRAAVTNHPGLMAHLAKRLVLPPLTSFGGPESSPGSVAHQSATTAVRAWFVEDHPVRRLLRPTNGLKPAMAEDMDATLLVVLTEMHDRGILGEAFRARDKDHQSVAMLCAARNLRGSFAFLAAHGLDLDERTPAGQTFEEMAAAGERDPGAHDGLIRMVRSARAQKAAAAALAEFASDLPSAAQDAPPQEEGMRPPVPAHDWPATTKAWLAASRAVCPNGQLKVLWHGSSTDIATFDDRPGPVWFTDDRNVAEIFGHPTYPPPKAAHLAMRHPATDEDLIAHAERLGIEVDDNEPLRTLEFEPELLRSLKEIGRDGSIGAESSTTSCHTVRSWLVGREAQVVLNGLVELKPRCSP